MELALAAYILSVVFIIWLISVLALWQLFDKAGVAGWKSIVPIYNSYLLATAVAKQSVWVWLLSFVPVLGIIGVFLVADSVAKSFGKSTVYAIVGLIIFPYFGYLVLGWGNSKYAPLKRA